MAPSRIPMPEFLIGTYTEEQYNAMSRKERMRRRNGVKDRSRPHIRKPIPEGWAEKDFLLLSIGQRYNLRHPEQAEKAWNRQKIRTENEKLENFSNWAYKNWVYHLWREYRLTAEQYWTLHEKQNGVCKICKNPESYSLKRKISYDREPIEYLQKLSVDHDHTTGDIRGLLCFSCNRRLHSSAESFGWLSAALGYLDTSENDEGKLYIKEGARQFPKGG